MPQLLDKVWIAPAVMAGSFLIILLIGKRLPEKGRAAIGILAVTVCFLFSLVVGAQWIQRVNHPPTGAEFAAATATCLDGPGGQQHEIEGVDREALLAGEWEVGASSTRVALRLARPEGSHAAPLAWDAAREWPSEGLVRGAVQVPPSGLPALFLADHPVTGGYPVVAVVLDADTDVAAQARPGQRIRFVGVSG